MKIISKCTPIIERMECCHKLQSLPCTEFVPHSVMHFTLYATFNSSRVSELHCLERNRLRDIG